MRLYEGFMEICTRLRRIRSTRVLWRLMVWPGRSIEFGISDLASSPCGACSKGLFCRGTIVSRRCFQNLPWRCIGPTLSPQPQTPLLEGSWDLVSKVVGTLIGVISSYKYSYPNYNPSY